jgi:hypothetical protein
MLVFYFQAGPQADLYASGESAYAKWRAAPEDEALYQTMRGALQKTPALEKRYEAAIAQTLFDLGKTEEGLGLARNSLKRVDGETPFHTAYAAQTLLIQQGNYSEALKGALELQEKMDVLLDRTAWNAHSLSGGSLLYAYNLLRIASLQQELGNQAGEQAAWAELETYFEKNPLAAQVIRENFSESGIGLDHYLQKRRRL